MSRLAAFEPGFSSIRAGSTVVSDGRRTIVSALMTMSGGFSGSLFCGRSACSISGSANFPVSWSVGDVDGPLRSRRLPGPGRSIQETVAEHVSFVAVLSGGIPGLLYRCRQCYTRRFEARVQLYVGSSTSSQVYMVNRYYLLSSSVDRIFELSSSIVLMAQRLVEGRRDHLEAAPSKAVFEDLSAACRCAGEDDSLAAQLVAYDVVLECCLHVYKRSWWMRWW